MVVEFGHDNTAQGAQLEEWFGKIEDSLGALAKHMAAWIVC